MGNSITFLSKKNTQLAITLISSMFVATSGTCVHAMKAATGAREPVTTFAYKAHSAKEATMMASRLKKIAPAISTFMEAKAELSPDVLPNVTVAVSGGGWIAAIAELGLLQGLEDIGLLDGITAIATSSGSTWTLSTLLKLHTLTSGNASLSIVEKYLRPRMAEGFEFTKDTIKDWLSTAKERHAKGLPFDLTCLWGEALTRQFLDQEEDRSAVHTLDAVTPYLMSGDLPMPLFASVIKPEVGWCNWSASKVPLVGKKLQDYPYFSLEYSPFTTRLSGDNTPAIETKDLGVTWNYLLGTWGSAYAFNIGDGLSLMYEALNGKWAFCNCLRKVRCCCVAPTNPISPTITNFMKGDEGPFATQKYLRPVDSGIDLKIPFPLVLDRKPSIIIACDVSSDRNYKNGTHSLEQTAAYATRNEIPFPHLPSATVLADAGVDLIIDEKNPDAPMIIYLKSSLEESMVPTNDDKKFSRIRDEMRKLVTNNKKLFQTAIAAHIKKRTR